MSDIEQNSQFQFRRLGNLAASSTSEVMVCARGYVEPASQAQRSVVSTNAQDKAGGTGSVAVRLTYLDSSYLRKTEDIALNGTTPVNTVASDIRFVEDFFVIQGAAAAGAIKLMTATAGGGTEITGIGIGTEQAFLCHHYVPAGMKCYFIRWGASVDDESKFKLKGQKRYGDNLVDVNIDLRNLMGITPPGFLDKDWELYNMAMGEKTYWRVTVVPNQSTATTIRANMMFWEEP